MTTIVALVKQVPDTYSERRLSESDLTLDRAGADAVIDEINQHSVEAALRIREELGEAGGPATVIAVTMGPQRATEALRKALSMGADSAILLADDALAGSDAVQTGWALHNVLQTIDGGVDLVVAGNVSTDGGTGAVPQVVGVYWQRPVLSNLRALNVEAGTGSGSGAVTGEREDETGVYQVRASLPAIVTVTEKANSPRFPSFKGIMAAKKKTITELTLADLAGLGVAPEQVGLAHAATVVQSATPRPARQAGERIVDDGTAGVRLAHFLRERKFI